MALSHSDITTRPWTRAIAAATAVAGPCRIMGMLLTAGTDAATLTIHNKATADATDIITIKAAANATTSVNIGPNGTRFNVGLSIAATGTSPTLAVFYILE